MPLAGWGGTPVYAGLTAFGGLEIFFLIQVLDLARIAHALSLDLARWPQA